MTISQFKESDKTLRI